MNTEYLCDICGSQEINETQNGYVCRSCGIVLNVQKFLCHESYANSNLLQYNKLDTTNIGTYMERKRSANSIHLSNLQNLQKLKNHDEHVLDQAKKEISKIFTSLNYPISYKLLVFHKFKEIYFSLQPYTKYRNPEKLVPVTIYFYFKINKQSINEPELLEVSKITKKEFNAFKLKIYKFFPYYAERDRFAYILQKVLEISEHFHLGMKFYYQSKIILKNLWDFINNTKDDVIAGFVCSLSALCMNNYGEKVSVNHICKRLGIKMSTIQLQVKKKIFEKFKIAGFTTLIQSSDLLKKVLMKMGLIKVNFLREIKSLEERPQIIEIKLGNTKHVISSPKTIKYYFYALKDNNRFPLFISVKPNIKLAKGTYSRFQKRFLFETEILKFYTKKGPPYLN